ncbi:MAG TPA: TlpA disulfide reductase family protein [Ignavibacteria bacterium]|jgi:peroxiredoxin|nr:TlpA disulfide reductase family protein [Ignavibacteria bacterium]
MKKLILLSLLLLAAIFISKNANAQVYSDFTLPDLDNNDATLSKYLEKGPVMVSFWATWCGPCKEELKRMQPIFEQYKDKGFTYLAVSCDNQKSISKVKSYITSNNYSFPVVLDFEKKVFEAYGGREDDMPYFVIISKDKQILYSHLGFKTGDEKEIEEKIKSALNLQ